MASTSAESTVSIRQPPQPKVALLYHRILTEPDIIEDDGFWHELFLLWANVDRLTEAIGCLTQSQLLGKKNVVNDWARRCVATATAQPISIRTVNALRSFVGLTRGVCGSPPRAFGVDRVDLLLGARHADAQMRKLLDCICMRLLNAQFVAPAVTLAHLNAMLAIITCADNLDGNVLIEYVLASNLFEALTRLLGTACLRGTFGRDALLLVSLLVNYRKYDNMNSSIVQLSILDDELALTGYNQTIASELVKYNNRFRNQASTAESTGLFSSVSNWLGGMFVPEQSQLSNVETDAVLLLAMYEAVHLNRNFITTLTNISAHEQQRSSVVMRRRSQPLPSASDDGDEMENGGDSPPSASSTPVDEPPAAVAECTVNLLSAFLTYTSVVLHDLKNDNSCESATLCAVILTCIVEDQYANALMHDVNMSMRVPLYRAPMLHRPGLFDKQPPLWPLACTVFELAREFIASHLMKQLPFDMHSWILSIVHKILCYQKRLRVRLQYNWRELWTALFSLLKFLTANETKLMPVYDLFILYNKIVTIMNLFVTFGDTFLPTAAVYDQLYYELVRQSSTFDTLFAICTRHSSASPSARQQSAARLANQLLNIRGIIAHFTAKLDDLKVNALTEDEVLGIIRENYDSLTLKLYENLDVFERYAEKQPKLMNFFRAQVSRIVLHTRQQVVNDARVTSSLVVQQLSSSSSQGGS